MLHWDTNLKLPIPYKLQGLLYLTDVKQDSGAFHCVAGFHHKIENWIKNLPQYAGARLPTESEWEALAHQKSQDANDLFNQAWQWTNSSYSAYPGYQPWGGIAGEYNGKFMVNQMVLRGSSDLTSKGHSRFSYRNFFPTHIRWQKTGLRVAKDL